MKKTLSLILAALIASAVFTACKNNEIPNIQDDTNADVSDTTNNEESPETLTYAEMTSQLDNVVEKNEIDNKVVMSVNDYKISLAQYRYYYMYWISWFSYNYGADWHENADQIAIFNEYVNQDSKMPAVIVNLAQQKGISLTQKEFDEEILSTLDQIQLQYGADADQILYEEFFITPYFMLENKIAYLLYNKLFEDFTAQNTETYKNIKNETVKFYNDNNYVRAKHILIAFADETDEAKEEARKKAEDVLKKVNAGEDFDALIAQYNEDPGMTSNPYGYYFGAGTMVAPFENATRDLEVGKTSGLVETSYGYHIIKRLAIEDDDIVNSKKFLELASAAFDDEMFNNLDSTTADTAENFDTLIQPVIDEGNAYIEKVIAQQNAVNITEDTAE